MIPVRDNMVTRETPVVTWTLVALNVLVFLWDRNGLLGGPSVAFADLAMRPSAILLAIRGRGDMFELAKVFTSMFLHGGLAHLIGNMLFLAAFGPSVERALGGPRMVIYYLFWGVVAAGAHMFVSPGSAVPTLGASGAIGGVLGAYFLLFPGNRITIIIPPFFLWPFEVSAWVMLGMWFVYQILIPQEGVANWAHAGGFLAGMLTVLVMGGREKALSGQRWEREDDEFERA